ncbi:MAG: hypothetical protein OHK0052_22360 [Anaerolineales bacterium]
MPAWIDPNIGYVLLMLALLVSLAAMLMPGSGVWELAALILLTLTAVQVVSQPVNLWALVVMLLGIFPLGFALRRKGDGRFLAGGIALLLLGAAWLFHGEGWLPAAHPLVLVVVSAATGWALWFFTRRSLQTLATPPVMNVDRIVGEIGETRTPVHDEGSVYALGELWSARSTRAIPPRQRVRVVRREGFVLIVEPIQDEA